jgi:polyisoprenoid-binding protein YceI
MGLRSLCKALLLPVLLSGAAAAADLYRIDTPHSKVGFSIHFMSITDVEGRFNDFSGAIFYDEADPSRSSVTAVIKPASIDTNFEMRDKDLRGSDFFDVEKYPAIVFQSRRVEKQGDSLLLTGDFTMHGVTKEVAFPCRMVQRVVKDVHGDGRILFQATVHLNRHDFGVHGRSNMPETFLASDVEITLNILGWAPDLEHIDFSSKGKPSIGAAMYKTIGASGLPAAIAQYRDARQKQPDAYNFDEDQLNLLGLKLLSEKKVKEAIEVFELNIEAFPKRAPLFYRLGDAYEKAGNRELALQAYRKALEVDPYYPMAMEALRRISSP